MDAYLDIQQSAGTEAQDQVGDHEDVFEMGERF